VFNGKADGGEGQDKLRIATGGTASRTIVTGQITSFEDVFASGSGTLDFQGGAHDFDSFEIDGGNVRVGGGASLRSDAGGVRFTGNADNRFTLAHGGAVGSLVDGGDGDNDVLAFEQAAGQTQNVSGVQAQNFEVLAATGEGYLNIDEDRTFDRVQIEGGNVKVLADVTLTADVIGGAGADSFDNAGTVDGDVLLGDGDDTYVARTGSSVTGAVDGGDGDNDTVVYSLVDGAGSLLDDIVNFESLGVYGPGTLSLDMQAGENWNSIKLMDEANLDLKSSGGTIGQINGDDSNQRVTVDGALTGGVDMGGGDDVLDLTLGGVLSGEVDGGAGNDVLNLKLTSASRINGMYNFETANISGGQALTLGGALGASQGINFDRSDDELIIAEGAVFEGTVDGGAGQNLLRVQSGDAQSRTVVASQILNFQDLVSEGAGMLALTGGTYDFDSVAVNGGSLELGANTVVRSDAGVVFDGADNRLVLAAGSRIEGGIDAGDGADTLQLAQAQGEVRIWSTLEATGFERLESSGAGELRFNTNAAFVNGVSLNGGQTTVMADTTLTADVTGGEAAETFSILGTLDGDLDLAGGDDRLIFAANGSGLRSGGEGSDTLEFRGAGAGVVNYDGDLWSGFEKLAVSGGVLSMTGVSDWQGLTLTGGRLVGQAGSVITSSSAIEVGAGSVFGSAGTVNADINVRGTLSPGASPGTMTVNGDVSFFSGSNLLMELSPQVSDLLSINGAMNIASGATIDITGVLPSTPGQVLDLIVASEGINGRFTTINKSETIFGFVAQDGNKLQIRGEFQNDDAYGSNAQRSIAYANAVLASGQAVQAFTSAVSVLVDAEGVSNADAFEQLTPEAYGSAMQVGTETALSLVEGVRGLDMTAPKGEGFYTFAQAVGLGAELDGRQVTGASSGKLDMGGMFGGVGYASGQGFNAGAFVGKMIAEQDLRDLGASTKTDGVLAGAFIEGRALGLNVSGMVAYDQTEARTQRSMAATPETGRGNYELRTWTADVNVAYPVTVGGLTVEPNAGLTYASTARDMVSEITGGAFALMVDDDTKSALFADVGVKVTAEASFMGHALRPWMEAGVRQLLSDRDDGVTGAFQG
ncbi:MAG: autotransporter outer membrane beta-barrel domain-containing protein, partial [Brevundimonas sp.]